VYGGDTEQVSYAAGDSFGELALLHSAPRAATVSTAEPTCVWVMERTFYTHLKRQYFQRVHKDKVELLDMVPSFSRLNPQQMDLLVDAMESVSFPADHAIITQVSRSSLTVRGDSPFL
jgi:cAMP-dependent protein kinase regulator